ncbi:DUF6287 domain-containing protein [Streptococcus suis]|uniref:DUF6287 domain-containing protein n=1 Tax=Streptococcus suis TaxID=1307 RepID=UPI0037CFBC4E
MKKTILFILLFSSVLLSACGKDTQKSVGEASQTSTSQTKQATETSTSQTKQATETSTSQTKQATETSTTTSTAPSATQSNESSSSPSNTAGEATVASNASTAQSGIDIRKIAKLDFSSVAGTWVNDSGESITFDVDGLVSDTHLLVGPTNTGYQGNISFTYGEKGNPVGSMVLTIIPKGNESSGGNFFDQDVLIIGQSIDAEDHPYYKQ